MGIFRLWVVSDPQRLRLFTACFSISELRDWFDDKAAGQPYTTVCDTPYALIRCAYSNSVNDATVHCRHCFLSQSMRALPSHCCHDACELIVLPECPDSAPAACSALTMPYCSGGGATKEPRAKRGERQAQKAAHRTEMRQKADVFEDAVVWCLSTGKGAKQAVKNPAFQALNPKTLHSRLVKQKKLDEAREQQGYMYETDSREILLSDEVRDLVQWLKDCNKGKRPRNRETGNAQVCELLRFRKAAVRKGGRAVAGRSLSARALECLKRGGASPEWWQKLEQEHPDLYGRQPHNISAKRQRQYHEDTVTEHFHGRY